MNILKGQEHPIRRDGAGSRLIEEHMKESALNALEVVGVDATRRGLLARNKVLAYAFQNILHQPSELLKRAKKMTHSTEEAIETIKRVEGQAYDSLNKLIETSNKLEDAGKQVSQKVRMHAEKMAMGVKKIQASANFGELEKHTLMLERMAEAMKTLAELESRGMLARISTALK